MSTVSMSSATGARYKVIIMLISQWYVSTAATQLHHVSQVIHKVQSVQTGQQYKYIPMRVANLLCRPQLVSQCVYRSSALFCLLISQMQWHRGEYSTILWQLCHSHIIISGASDRNAGFNSAVFQLSTTVHSSSKSISVNTLLYLSISILRYMFSAQALMVSSYSNISSLRHGLLAPRSLGAVILLIFDE